MLGMQDVRSAAHARLGKFVPAIVEDWLPEDASVGQRQEVQAVLLFIDIVGFSRLSARLVQAHDRGAEQTQRLVNDLFARIIAVIARHGGGVASIAGDSLQAYWTAAPAPGDAAADPSAQVHRAAACATEILRAHGMGIPGEDALQVKVLLDAGLVHLTVVGEPGGEVFPILSGPLIESLPGNSAMLQPGKVLAAPALVGAAGQVAEFAANSSGLAELLRVTPLETAAPARSDRRALRFVPALARALVGGSADDWVAEFRRASVLFAEVSQFALRDADRFAAFAANLQAAVSTNGGAIVQFQTDDKGLILVAAWGLAVSAHENDAERAIHSGRLMLEAARQDAMPCKIGISTGNLLCGLLGGADYQQIAIMSETVNLASALAMRASAGLLVDPETRRLAEGRFAFEDRGPFQPKGREEILALSTPTKETRAKGTFGPRLIGRDREIETLLAAFDGASRAPLIQISGEAGLGKSHLGAVLAARLSARGIEPVFGYCDSLRRSSAFHAWQRPVETLLFGTELPPIADRAGALTAAAVEAGLKPAARSLLHQLLDLPGDDGAALRGLSPQERAQTARDAIGGLLESLAAGRQVALVFEDVHWMDSASWQVLAEVRARLPQLALILLSRPVEITDLPVQAARMLRDDDGPRLTLAPLGRAETDELICAELQITEQPPSMLERIFELAEGHPLYTKELAKLFVDRGLVHVDSSFAHIPSTKIDLREVTFPGGIEGVVSARISQMAPDVQLTLKVAAVQGRDIDHAVIKRAHPDPDARIEDHLAVLHASGLVDAVSATRSRFHHALIVDTAYALLLTDQRQALHRRIALIYQEALDKGATDIPSPLIAHHWDEGGEPKAALAHLRKAASLARRSQANAEVVAFLTRALELDRDHGPLVSPEEAASMHMSLAVALMSLGHLVATDAHMAAALAIFDKAPPETNGQYVRETLASYLSILRGRRGADGPPDERKLNAARVYLGLSEIYYDRQDTLRSLHATFSAMRLAASSDGDSGPLATAMSQLAMVSVVVPWALRGERWKTRAIDMSNRLQDPGVAGWVHMTTGAYAFAKADFPEAERLTRTAIDSAAAARDHKCWEYSVANLGNILRLQGRFAEADVQDVLTYDSGHDRGVPQVKLWGVTGRMKNLWALNAFEAFEQSVLRARSLITDELNKLNSAASNTIAYHVFAALYSIRRRETEAALGDLMAAVDLFDRLKDPQIYMVDPVSYVLEAGHALAGQGADPKALDRVFDVMARKSKKLVKLYPSASARLALARGDLAEHRGDLKTAARHWQKAVTSADALRMPFDAAMAHHRLGLRGGLDGPAAEAHLGRMQACLDGLGLAMPEGWQPQTSG